MYAVAFDRRKGAASTFLGGRRDTFRTCLSFLSLKMSTSEEVEDILQMISIRPPQMLLETETSLLPTLHSAQEVQLMFIHRAIQRI